MQYIQFEISDNVAYIRLNRPDVANSLHTPMSAEIHQAAKECRDNKAVRAVLITGNGAFFSAGGDLATFAKAGDALPQNLHEMLIEFHGAIEILAALDAPVIAAVNGTAAGAGLSMVAAASLAIASEKARFTMAYTGAGLSPDGSSSYFLPRLIGARRCQELMLTNRQLSAQEALDWGLVNEVLPADEVFAKAEKLAKRLAKGPTRAYGQVNKLIAQSFDNSLSQQLTVEAEGIVAMASSNDGKEGISAFMAKRAAAFTGE